MEIPSNQEEDPETPVYYDRRCGIDRRVMTYDWYIPERRTGKNRRQADKYEYDVNHSARVFSQDMDGQPCNNPVRALLNR